MPLTETPAPAAPSRTCPRAPDLRMIDPIMINPAMINEMRAWIADCAWRDLEPEEIDDLSDATVLRGIVRHYSGGIAQFIADGV
jgi:hypothetical protein